ncbi:MAG: LysR family transcriptional regulator [Planctomycetaceae bacterium]|nr:LysR family transcriptional regulator [Planctomycetaceae bacterium]
MNHDRTETLNLAQLRTFQMVMQAGGYSAAARQSRLSVPSVWQHIQALEKAYGVSLFVRQGRQVQPTEAAQRLSRQVESVLVQLDSTFDVVGSDANEQTIRLVTGARMLLEDMTEPLAEFHRHHNNRLVIRQGNGLRAEELLLADEADIGMTLEPGFQQQSDSIHYEPAYTVEFMAVAKRSHPWTKAGGGLRELSRHELVVTAEGTHGRDALDRAFHRDGLTANIVAETDNSAFTLACVSAGMGVGILAGRPQGQLSRKLVSRSLSRQLGQRKIVFMWRKGRLLSDAMVDFVETVIEMNK